MELGLDLDDDSLFEIPKDPKERHMPPAFPSKCNLKICSPQWFYDDKCVNDLPKDYTCLKYRADHEYITQQYDIALTHYQQSQAMLQHVGSATWRDIEEGKIRCLINLGRLLESLVFARKLAQMAQNVDHVTAALHLLLDIQRKLNNSLAESQLMRKLILLHPQVPRLWMRLGELCESREDISGVDVHTARIDAISETDVAETAPETESHRTNGVVEKLDRLKVTADLSSSDLPTVGAIAANVRALTCYTMARSLLRKVRKTVSSFAKEQNEQLIIEVQDRLEKLAVPQSVSESCRKFVQRMLNSMDNETTTTSDADNIASSIDDIVTGHHDLAKMTDENFDIGEEFDSQWFAWYQSINGE